MSHSKLKSYLFLIILNLISFFTFAQTGTIKGVILDTENKPLPFASVVLRGKNVGNTSNTEGVFEIEKVKKGKYTLVVTAVGFQRFEEQIDFNDMDKPLIINVKMTESDERLQEVVVTGTMKEVRRSESPAPIEVFNAKFFLKNPSPNLFESLGNINGVRPQLQCSVCNTGDIHINGMEGPYTMVLIDGMPIVSGLSTVYGLMGIPNSMIERIEVMKGPASTLYGSEAVGGLINVITKSPNRAPVLSLDISGTSYAEFNNDVAFKFKVGKATSLVSGNYFHFNTRWDKNNDGFTDVTLAKRASIFNKWSFEKADNKRSEIAFRYVYEDRFGGQMTWNPTFRGGDSIYGETILTNRFEVIGMHDFLTKQPLKLQYSFNSHDQKSAYGSTLFDAQQRIGFAQLTTPYAIGKNNFLLGLALRYTYYDDNSVVTVDANNPSVSKPQKTWLPGIFVQNEVTFNPKNKILMGLRLDYNAQHDAIISPRFNYKWTPNGNNTVRLSYGNGFRVVNIFSEDHAALQGSRILEVKEALRPEKSHNVNVNYVTKFFPKFGFIGLDASVFYTYFDNKIIADYDTDPNKIIYDNLKGHGISRGVTLNSDFNFTNGLKILLGATYTDVFTKDDSNVQIWQIQTPKFTANWSASYTFPKSQFTFDLTGTTTSPMRLPVLANDFRAEQSPWFSIINVQVKKEIRSGFEVYGGLKNILNFLPQNPLMRPFDPFDKNVNQDNPNNYSFDTNYNYAPLQGIRGYLGLRFTIK